MSIALVGDDFERLSRFGFLCRGWWGVVGVIARGGNVLVRGFEVVSGELGDRPQPLPMFLELGQLRARY